MRGLTFFTKTNGERLYNIAAYHSPHSLTWSWILSVRFERKWRLRFLRLTGREWMLLLPGASVQWHRQEPMFYRDMWRRDEEERLSR